jgi:hypothetical protein
MVVRSRLARIKFRKIGIKESAKDLLEAIETNYETIKGQTYVKQQYIADEMDELKQLVKK